MFTPPSAAERPVTQQDAVQAARMLGVMYLANATPGQVRNQFRLKLQEAHPDAGGDAAAAPERIAELRAARDTLLRWLEQAPKADCRECGGTGYVWGKLALKPCSRCG
jgi:aspartate/methionine/tyrosine aminotransferase